MRTSIYIDGFNLYYGAVKGTPYKWLDFKAAFGLLLQPHHQITAINYFTAQVSGKRDPQQPVRQQTYWRALQAMGRSSRSTNPILCSPYRSRTSTGSTTPSTGIPTKEPGAPTGELLVQDRAHRQRAAVNWLHGGGRARRLAAGECAARRRAALAGQRLGGASETTKKLLRHWWREDRGRRLFFCQVEAVETIIYLREMLALGRSPRFTPQADAGGPIRH
jgi:hypothetical protein